MFIEVLHIHELTGATIFPVCPICMSLGTNPASTAALDAPTVEDNLTNNYSGSLRFNKIINVGWVPGISRGLHWRPASQPLERVLLPRLAIPRNPATSPTQSMQAPITLTSSGLREGGEGNAHKQHKMAD